MKRIEAAVVAAREAGDMVRSASNKSKTISIKPDRTMVTEFDLLAEKMIIAHLRGFFPKDGFLGEELGLTRGESGYTWVIDPIDGTHNFIARIPLWGVSIGLALGKELVGGVIYLPETNEMFSASKGNGAFCNGEAISVSGKTEMAQCTLSYDSGMRRETDRKVAALHKLSSRTYNVRMLGTSSVLLSYLADGRIDLAVEFDDKPWDFAAGACIVREAGGRFTGLDGSEMMLDTIGYIGSNGGVHSEAMEILKEFR